MKRTRFFQKNLTSGKYITEVNGILSPNKKALENDVDRYFNKILPIVAGLANSTAELENLSTDQYMMINELSVKVLELQQNNMTGAIIKGLGLDQAQPQSDDDMGQQVIDAMKGG